LIDGENGRAPERHVLADRGDGVRDGVLHRPAARRQIGAEHGLELAVRVQRRFRDGPDEALELLVARNEVGFGVELDHGRAVAALGHGDEAFRSDPAGLLGRLGEALGPQPVDRRLHLAAASCSASCSPLMPAPGFLAQLLSPSETVIAIWLFLSNCSQPASRR
jgi:hypothetical protein